jgi:hypothetical protein
MNPQAVPVLTATKVRPAPPGILREGFMNLKRAFYQSVVSVKEFGESMGHHVFSRLFCGPVIFLGKVMMAIASRFSIEDLSR